MLSRGILGIETYNTFITYQKFPRGRFNRFLNDFDRFIENIP